MKSFFLIFFISIEIVRPSPNIFAQTSKHPSRITTDKYIVVDGHKMHYQTGGKGSTTVIFENGHGDDLSSWDDIFPEVAEFAKVIRYDRAGYGSSEPTTQPRSLKQIAKELNAMLQQANIHPPYILVGHSMGGALIRAFAYLYKDKIAGLVFVDPFTEYEANGMTEKEIQQEMKSVDSMMKGAPAPILSELEVLKQEIVTGFPEINSFGSLPDVPMVLLVAGKNRPFNWEKNAMDMYEAKMHNLSETRLVVLPQSPHYIQGYDPALVIESIRSVIFPNAENALRKTLHDKVIDSCIAQYKKMKATYPRYFMTERILNTLGYEVLSRGNAQDAITLFALNVIMYPNSFNCYDSLGEAYMNAGNKKEAIKNYEKSLALNPSNTNGVKMLKKLK